MEACYIHVPFCKDICAYCDFVRCRYQKNVADAWLRRMKEDITQTMTSHFKTIYIGGGTPTALSDEQFDTLLQTIKPYTLSCIEYTLEANPDSLTMNKIELLQKGKVNRISLGIQTFQQSLQHTIHRFHTIEHIQQLLSNLHRHDIHNVSIDLMYGLPKQTFEMWKQDLETAVSLSITHISLYALTIEEHSEFGRKGVQPADTVLEADMYEYAIKFLNEHGFQQYEISNFAKYGMESKHNITYWNYEDFIGIGCGASGKELHCRYENTRNIHTYIKEGSSPNIIPLSKQDEMFEMIMMSLRMTRGMDIQEFQQRFNIDVRCKFKQALQTNIEKKYLYIQDDFLRTTYQGMLLLNDILLDFLD